MEAHRIMILSQINFGHGRSLDKEQSEETADNYISSLFHSGQLCGERFMTWIKGELIFHATMPGLGADKLKFHSDYGKATLKIVIEEFGRCPVWTITDDNAPKRNASWKAPTLHLFTHAFDDMPPLCRGDTAQPIPTFLLPLDFHHREYLGRWQDEYILHDRMWLNSGTLEIAAYKQLVDPNSDLSFIGRDLCAEIEKATKMPTYYFLKRHYAASEGVDDRPCPSCGAPWHVPQPPNAPFHHWPFRCEPCRLVSTSGVDVNKRLAKIGQWPPTTPKSKGK